MRIYISASWRHRLAVELLTEQLREQGHEVVSFVEKQGSNPLTHSEESFDEWVWSEQGLQKFHFDLGGAMYSDIVIYIGPSDVDAWAEIGAAYGHAAVYDLPKLLGFHAKGEQIGLMRRMLDWHESLEGLLNAVALIAENSMSSEAEKKRETHHGGD